MTILKEFWVKMQIMISVAYHDVFIILH